MPLSLMKEGEPGVIHKVGGREETRRFLEKSRLCDRRDCNRGISDGRQSDCQCEGCKDCNRPGYGK